jgi:hypothetical protein
MEILGHSQIAITMNPYTHVDTDLNRAATDLMGPTTFSLRETTKRSPTHPARLRCNTCNA